MSKQLRQSMLDAKGCRAQSVSIAMKRGNREWQTEIESPPGLTQSLPSSFQHGSHSLGYRQRGMTKRKKKKGEQKTTQNQLRRGLRQRGSPSLGLNPRLLRPPTVTASWGLEGWGVHPDQLHPIELRTQVPIL